MKEKCINLSERGGCTVLNIPCCKDNCAFRQSAERHEDSDRTWKMRMRSLGSEQQQKIAKKYYYGDMPWNR